MKKTFQKTLIAASVGAALAVASIGAQAGTAGTTNLLFPYITTKASAFTFLSISQQGGTAAVASQPLHFTYATKPIGAVNSVPCGHVDGDAGSTKNDLMQFEVQNKVNVPAAFGDVTSSPKYFPAAPAGADQQGFLIVNNSSSAAYGEAAAYSGANLYGEARIIDVSSGLYMGYSTDDLHTADAANPDFGSAAGPDSGILNKVVSWFPTSVVTTSFYTLATGTELAMAYSGALTANFAATGPAPGHFFGHYNNNEGFQSSTATVGVTCFGTFTRDTLLGALNAPWSVNGGWANFERVLANPGTATNSLIYKVEATAGLGSFITRAPTY